MGKKFYMGIATHPMILLEKLKKCICKKYLAVGFEVAKQSNIVKYCNYNNSYQHVEATFMYWLVCTWFTCTLIIHTFNTHVGLGQQ